MAAATLPCHSDYPIALPCYMTREPATTVPVRIWDLPTRLFHWALAACVVMVVGLMSPPAMELDTIKTSGIPAAAAADLDPTQK